MDQPKGPPYSIQPCARGSSAYRIKRYRERAEELRTIADDLLHGECQETLLRIASSYEDMALQAAAIGEARGALGVSVGI